MYAKPDMNDSKIPDHRFTKRELFVLKALFAILTALLIVLICTGCGFALISKTDIGTFHDDFKTYRKYVAPTEEPEKVNLLGDNLEKVLEGWKGESNAK